MKMIIDLPREIHISLIKLAEKDSRKTKPYVEMIIARHVERKTKSKK